jgi:hypothetical protein
VTSSASERRSSDESATEKNGNVPSVDESVREASKMSGSLSERLSTMGRHQGEAPDGVGGRSSFHIL